MGLPSSQSKKTSYWLHSISTQMYGNLPLFEPVPRGNLHLFLWPKCAVDELTHQFRSGANALGEDCGAQPNLLNNVVDFEQSQHRCGGILQDLPEVDAGLFGVGVSATKLVE
jgi:hypothetical protein